MGRGIILVVVTGLLLGLTGTAAARRIRWKPSEKPPVLLADALALAEAELRKDDRDYYCLGASLAETFTGGDWELQYSAKDGTARWVSVGSDRSVRVSKDPFAYY